jgi:Domain of unknown function DUF29
LIQEKLTMLATSDPITSQPTLYDRDFHQWTHVMADAIRLGDWANLDIENLAEELESLGRQQRQELRNRLGILLGHLLKWQLQPQQKLAFNPPRTTPTNSVSAQG